MTTTTAVLKGKVQDLSKVVSNISPEETPFQTRIGKDTAIQTIYSWTEESLAASAQNALVEGAEAPAAADNIMVERQNRTQIFGKTVSISGTALEAKLAGDVQRMAHQVALRAKEIKKDVEYAYVGSGQADTAASGGTGALTAGYQAQIDASMVIDKAAAQVTEDDLNEALIRCHEAGARPSIIQAHSRLRASLAKVLFGNDSRRELVEDGKYKLMVTVYASDAGAVKIETNDSVRYDSVTKTGDILVIDPKMWSEKILRDFRTYDLAKTGDSESKFLVTERGLKNKNFKGSALITNVLV